MVTGIETAGLALAVFPIVVGGLKYYADGARTIKDMWRYEMTLNSLSRELGMEKCKFENTCTLLLEDVLSESHLMLLMERPGGPLWSADSLQEKLKSRLRPATVPCFMEAVETLASTLQSLQDEFGLEKDDKPELTDKKTLKKRLKSIKLILSKAEYKDQLAQITKTNSDLATLTGQSKLANSPSQRTTPAKYYKRIRNHAINLYEVLKETLQAAPACTCTVPHNANLRLEVRNATTTRKDRSQDTNLRFHIVFSFENDPTVVRPLPWNWREMGLEPLDSEEEPCESRQAKDIDNSGGGEDEGSHIDMVSHFTTVAEEIDSHVSHSTIDSTSKRGFLFRGKSELSNITRSPNPAYRSIKPPGKTSFTLPFGRPKRDNRPTEAPRNVSFSLPQVSCANPASVTPELISGNTTEQIENLCLTIQQAKSELSCIGILIDESSRRYRVWPPQTPPLTSEPAAMLSLENLLARPGVLKRKDRLILGVQLASTVMQLHTTEWLREDWGKRDILFYQEITQREGGSVARFNPTIRKPLVCRVFAPLNSQSLLPQTIQEPTKPVLVRHDQSLFSLGVILVELWYGQSLEDLRIEADGGGIGGVTDMTDYMTAWRLSSKISDEAGEKYGDAVRRCIIGLDHRDASLETDDFKNEVHMKVFTPLVENLESFCAMKLQELL